MALEQAGRGLRLGTDVDAVALARRLEPTPYDGADSRLKKMLVLDRLIVHTTDDSVQSGTKCWVRNEPSLSFRPGFDHFRALLA